MANEDYLVTYSVLRKGSVPVREMQLETDQISFSTEGIYFYSNF